MSLFVLIFPGRPAGSHQVSRGDPPAQRGQHQAGPTPLSAAEWSQRRRSHGGAVHLPDQPSGRGLLRWEPAALEHEDSEERVSLCHFSIMEDMKITSCFSVATLSVSFTLSCYVLKMVSVFSVTRLFRFFFSCPGITHSWRVAGCLCMPSPSRSQRTTPGTAATSGLFSLLRTCKICTGQGLHFWKMVLFWFVLTFPAIPLTPTQRRRCGQPPPPSAGLQWKEVPGFWQDPLWGL